jgi:hypothetical protein
VAWTSCAPVTTPYLDESIHAFEAILETMLEIAAFESKLKMLGEEILRVTRRTRALEERVLPRLAGQIKTIVRYLGEREREAYYRAFLDRSGQPEAEPPQRQGCDLFQRAWFFEQVACARNDL